MSQHHATSPAPQPTDLAVEAAGGEVGRAAVALVLDGAVVVDGELGSRDVVAEGHVAAGVEGVPDLEVETAGLDLVDGPGVGDVVRAGTLHHSGQEVGALDKRRAVAGRERGVADDLEGVAKRHTMLAHTDLCAQTRGGYGGRPYLHITE